MGFQKLLQTYRNRRQIIFAADFENPFKWPLAAFRNPFMTPLVAYNILFNQ
jgi:hypothetical protein